MIEIDAMTADLAWAMAIESGAERSPRHLPRDVFETNLFGIIALLAPIVYSATHTRTPK